jgi:hypothetical protein
MKMYGGMSGRRSQTDVRDALQRGHISKPVHYNTLSKYLEKPELTPLLKELIAESAAPLRAVEWNFAVNSSGFSTGIYKRWAEAKWGRPRLDYADKTPFSINRRDWIKVHLMCGVKTNVVTSVEITDAHGADCPQFGPLVEQTAENFPIQSVAADKAYSSSKNMHLVLVKGGMPYIGFKSNAKGNAASSTAVWRRMYHLYEYNREEFMRCYHRRSNVETTFSMIKRKFGERLRSKTPTAQANEVLCKILCHNICVLIQSMYELGVDVDFAAEG